MRPADLRAALFPKFRRTDFRPFQFCGCKYTFSVAVFCLNGRAFFVSQYLAVRAFGIDLLSPFIDDGEIVQLQVRRGLVQMHGSRQDIPIGTVIADLPFQKGVTVRKELLQFQREGLAGNIAAFFKESLVARDNDALEGDGLLCLLEGRVEVLHRLLPLRVEAAFRFFEIVVERRALAVDVLIAVTLCCALRLRTDLPEIAL